MFKKMKPISKTILKSHEYKFITDYYGNKVAKRSQVPLINHINEGVKILQYRDVEYHTITAFCIHPIIQADIDFANNVYNLKGCLPYSLIFAIEYRNIANQYLSYREISSINEINLSPITEVNDMLVDDKIQNYKDFIIYHKATHARSMQLDIYFNNWLSKYNKR